MSHYGLSEAEEHQYPPLEEVLPNIKVLTDIGSINREISLVARGEDNRLVSIGGDYKCVVPENTIHSKGKDFFALIDDIISKL